MKQQLLNACIPAFAWLREYDRAWLRDDLVAGFTAAAVVVPRRWHTPISPGYLYG
jgi:MFS superfamily sulfate permease-like transporter